MYHDEQHSTVVLYYGNYSQECFTTVIFYRKLITSEYKVLYCKKYLRYLTLYTTVNYCEFHRKVSQRRNIICS